MGVEKKTSIGFILCFDVRSEDLDIRILAIKAIKLEGFFSFTF